MVRVNMHEAKTQLSKLVERAEAGEDVVIQRAGRPAVRLVPVPAKRPFREALGMFEGQIWIADDFDELPDEFLDHFR